MKMTMNGCHRNLTWRLPCCLLALALSACSQKPDSMAIRGQVTFQGKPLEKGTVSFTPENGASNAVVAAIKDGRYAVSLSPGPKRVQISSMKTVGKQQVMVGGEPRTVDAMRETIPEQYNAKSSLRIDVSAESNKDFDFIL
jgi:hypothetical protein